MKIFRFFRNLFAGGPAAPEEPFEYGKLCLLSFAINRYHQSPLRGCINDQKDISEKLKSLWPGFTMRLFQDYDCTRALFKAEIRKAFAAMRDGWLVIQYSGHGTYSRDQSEKDGYSEALYLYDGALPDEDIYELMQEKPEGLKVVFILDCCFSTGITLPRAKSNPCYSKPRFLASEPMPETFKVSRVLINEPIDWVVFAACGERETAADAVIGNRPNGIYSYYLSRVMRRAVFLANWQKDVDKCLPSPNFQQTPSLTGSEELMNTIPFEVSDIFFEHNTTITQ